MRRTAVDPPPRGTSCHFGSVEIQPSLVLSNVRVMTFSRCVVVGMRSPLATPRFRCWKQLVVRSLLQCVRSVNQPYVRPHPRLEANAVEKNNGRHELAPIRNDEVVDT